MALSKIFSFLLPACKLIYVRSIVIIPKLAVLAYSCFFFIFKYFFFLQNWLSYSVISSYILWQQQHVPPVAQILMVGNHYHI